MEETLLEKTIHALAFLGVCAAIIFIGWHEPLRYRFMSPAEIVELEGDPEPVRQNWQSTSSLKGTALDRAPYEVREGKVRYSKGFDPRQMGAPTETDQRANTRGKQ
ncbi:MAG: hypothetical protein WCF18_20960 [Chthoniobacteraceae bacterium]